MKPIRIHLGDMPALMRAIIEALLANEPDLILVGSTKPGEDPLIRAREEQADMLITTGSMRGDGEPGPAGRSCLDAVLSGPPLCILTIDPSGRGGRAVNLASTPVDLDRDEPAQFASAVRRVAGAA